MSSVADGDLARLPKRPMRNLYFGPVAPHWGGATRGLIGRIDRLTCLAPEIAVQWWHQAAKPDAPPENWSQFFNPSDLGLDRFLGDCLSSKAINSRPEADTPTLPPRTISLALRARP